MAQNAAQFKNYAGVEGFGGSEQHSRVVFAPGKRRRINLVAVCLNLWIPFIQFTSLYYILSFKFHYKNPVAARLLVFVYFGIAFCTVGHAFYVRRKRDRDPMWYMYTAFSSVFAVATATVFGNLNFVYNLLPYYEINSLNTYPSVNPATKWGQELMDAGRVYFSDGTGLDMKKSMSFTNSDTYCVAPIVNGDTKLSHYDFWAVGINCCSTVSSDFRCGQFNNPKARSGLRQMSSEERPFFRLAVQMAEATYNLQSPHPLFFTWIQDPVAEMEDYIHSGWKYFLLGVSTHFALNLFSVLSAMVIFSKIGYLQ